MCRDGDAWGGFGVQAGAAQMLPIYLLASSTAFAGRMSESDAGRRRHMQEDMPAARSFMQKSPRLRYGKFNRVTSPDRTEATALMAANALRRGVAGDFVEAGVYYGASSILMMHALLISNTSEKRLLWACDSFQGLPRTSAIDLSAELNCTRKLAGGQMCWRSEKGFAGAYRAGQNQFEVNMKINMPSDPAVAWEKRLRVVKGWFNATLPAAGMKNLSFIRIDGDLYASTRDVLARLYPLLSEGGLVYVDDYGSFGGCGKAVDDFLESRGCGEQISPIWERSRREGGWLKDNVTQGFEAVWWEKRSCS